MHGTGKYTPQQVIDSIIGSYGSIHTPYTEHISDVYISPEYLIDNIEQAFRVWKEQPWGKNVSFELFCEYVLPYRVGDEKLVSWRNEIYEKYNSLLDDVRDMPEAEDPYFVSKVLFDSLRRMPVYFTELFESGPHVGPKIVEWKSAGIVVAGADSLVYEVPSGCLLYLKNHTRGKDERIFEYRDGNQCFW